MPLLKHLTPFTIHMYHLFSSAVLSLILCTTLHAATDWKPLWNGRDLSGWSTWLQKPQPTSEVPGLQRGADGKYPEAIGSNRDPLKVFTVVEEDGRPAIRISGEVFGELRSSESFQNYRLRLQFKWGKAKWPPRHKPETQRDSGLLYHVHAEPGAEGRTWSSSIELQIQERDVGDLYAINSEISVRSTPREVKDNVVFDYDPKGEFRMFSQVPGKQGRCVKQPDNEKPGGEWNTVELVCFGEDAIHIVNGKVVMRLHAPRRIDGPKPLPVTSGPIILQSEGAELYYRDIEYVPITAIPPEFAEPSFRSLAVGATPESVVKGFDGKHYVTLMGTKREKGDGDGGIVRIDGDKVTIFTTGLDDPKGLVFAGGKLITTDFDTVWAIDENGDKTVLAAPNAFSKPPLFLNDVAVEPGGKSILVTEMGDLKAMFAPDGSFWPLDSSEAKNLPPLGRLYRMDLDGKVSVAIDHAPEFPNPNGVDILADGTILIAEFFRGTLMEWKSGKWRRISEDHRSGDGIVNDGKGNLYLTEVRSGRVWHIKTATGERKLLATLQSAADLILDEKNRQLIVPDSKAGLLVFIPLP
jgi:sugar lactone lactonase YvrE